MSDNIQIASEETLANNGNIEGNLSYLQSELVSEQVSPEMVSDVETTEEDYGEGFETYQETFASGDIDEQDLIAGIEEHGDLTPAGFFAITGIECVNDKQPERTSYEALIDDMNARITSGKATATTLLNLVYSREQAGLLSETEATNARDWLSEKIDNPIFQAIKEAATTIEHKTIDACRVDGEETARMLITKDTEIQTSVLSRLTCVFADYATLLVVAGRLPISPTMDRVLWELAVKDKILGDPIADDKDENGASLGASYDPYKDATLIGYSKDLCKKACLLAYGGITHVQFGFIPKERAIGRRMTTKMVFKPRNEVNLPDEETFRNVCVPANILKPDISACINPEGLTTDENGRDISNATLVLTKVKANDDTSLRHLSKEHAALLFEHHFKGDVLTYDTVSATSRIPTGYIIGIMSPNAPSVNSSTSTTTEAAPPTKRTTKGSQAEADQMQALKDTIKQQHEDNKNLRAMLENDGKLDVNIQMNALAAAFRDDQVNVSPENRLSFWQAAGALVKRVQRSNKLLTENEVRCLAVFLDDLKEILDVVDDEERVYEVSTVDGSLRHEYKLNGSK